MPGDAPRPLFRPWLAGGGAAAALAALLILAAALPDEAAVLSGRAEGHGRRTVSAADRYDAPTPRWREGPARYLLSKDEDDAFRALPTDARRQEFIRDFWSRRDPDPSTPVNEYREMFYHRVDEADRLFRESSTPGWKTDRGKLFVLLGPPDEVDTPELPRREAGDLVVWTYREPPGGAGPTVQATIRFLRDVTGEFRLISSIPSRLQAMMGVVQVQAMQMKSLPASHPVLDTIVRSGAARHPESLRVQTDYYRSDDQGTLVVLTVGVREDRLAAAAGAAEGGAKEDRAAAGGETVAGGGATDSPDASNLEVVARLVGTEEGLPNYDLAGPDALRPGPADRTSPETGVRLFQGGTAVKPGRYMIYIGIVEKTRGMLASYAEPVEIPAFPPDRLSLSSVALVDRLERLEGEGPATPYTPPFLIGRLLVEPRPGEAFRTGETLSIYFQVYGAVADPISGHPDIDIEYRFFKEEKGGKDGAPVYVPLGQPIQMTHQQNPTQAYSLTLTDWARANYRLRVLVRDNLSARDVSREVDFHVL